MSHPCLKCQKLKEALEEVINAHYFVAKDGAQVVRRRANAIYYAEQLLKTHD